MEVKKDGIIVTLIFFFKKKKNTKIVIYSDLLVSKPIGQGIIAAILGDIERLHGNEENKNFELG